jgi:hypothetical protein
MSAPYSINVDGQEYILAQALTTPAHQMQLPYDTRHRIFETMDRFGGGFARKLAAAWFVADTGNKHRIETAFPHLMDAYGPESEFWA